MNQIIQGSKKIVTILVVISLVAIGACEEDKPITTDFEASETTVLAGTEVTFTDLSVGGSKKWDWSFEGGTPSTSNLNFPTIIYSQPGTFDVTLMTSNGDNQDTEHKVDYITVLGEVTADFSISSAFIEAGTPVTFTDLSTGEPTTWEWSFPGANPSSSTEQNPVVTYENEGVYDVTLTSSHQLNSDEITKTKLVVVRRAVSHYKLDGNANDSGPLGLVGVVHGAVLAADRNAVANAAYSFDGVDDYIEMPYNHLAKELPLSVSFWVRFEELNTNLLDLDNASNQVSGIFMGVGQTTETLHRLAIGVGNGGPINPASRRTFISNNVLEKEQWYHIVAVVEGVGVVKAYLNGVELTGFYTGTGSSYFHSESYGTLGKTSNPSDVFKGTLDDFRVYNKALSAQEVLSIYSE